LRWYGIKHVEIFLRGKYGPFEDELIRRKKWFCKRLKKQKITNCILGRIGRNKEYVKNKEINQKLINSNIGNLIKYKINDCYKISI
jgi:hypothetical protein